MDAEVFVEDGVVGFGGDGGGVDGGELGVDVVELLGEFVAALGEEAFAFGGGGGGFDGAAVGGFEEGFDGGGGGDDVGAGEFGDEGECVFGFGGHAVGLVFAVGGEDAGEPSGVSVEPGVAEFASGAGGASGGGVGAFGFDEGCFGEAVHAVLGDRGAGGSEGFGEDECGVAAAEEGEGGVVEDVGVGVVEFAGVTGHGVPLRLAGAPPNGSCAVGEGGNWWWRGPWLLVGVPRLRVVGGGLVFDDSVGCAGSGVAGV
ncbi:Uncharacterised protein [Dermatophilus congolensis]|uniref:Uncharacterized protein n=1 Tax=Dermatophilus congolensis TaxID=1863 RepID=A0AA46H185_9MICO|nr:Uncharacterised protein [Dermatophilus congolensis]